MEKCQLNARYLREVALEAILEERCVPIVVARGGSWCAAAYGLTMLPAETNRQSALFLLLVVW